MSNSVEYCTFLVVSLFLGDGCYLPYLSWFQILNCVLKYRWCHYFSKSLCTTLVLLNSVLKYFRSSLTLAVTLELVEVQRIFFGKWHVLLVGVNNKPRVVRLLWIQATELWPFNDSCCTSNTSLVEVIYCRLLSAVKTTLGFYSLQLNHVLV